jgi:hypothetical protein
MGQAGEVSSNSVYNSVYCCNIAVYGDTHKQLVRLEGEFLFTHVTGEYIKIYHSVPSDQNMSHDRHVTVSVLL